MDISNRVGLRAPGQLLLQVRQLRNQRTRGVLWRTYHQIFVKLRKRDIPVQATHFSGFEPAAVSSRAEPHEYNL